MSVSWKVARMARPSRVFWMKRCAPTIRATATTPAKTRIATTWMGPKVSGTGENGCLMVLGDGSQMRIAAFWMMTDSATVASMGISMGWSRSRRRISRSTTAPTRPTPAHGQQACDEEVHAPEAKEREEEEGAQHEELAVGEVDHAHDAEDEGEADPHQGVAAAQDEAVDDVLDELGDHGLRDRGAQRRRAPSRAPAARA